MTTFRELVSDDDLRSVFPIMQELRTTLAVESFLNLTKEARKHDGYSLVGLFEGSECVALMGYRILFDLVHGKHLYIDDLVTSKNHRSKGYGAKLLTYAEEISEKNNCSGLRLCTGIDNSAGRKFYEREGWAVRSVVYKKKLKQRERGLL